MFEANSVQTKDWQSEYKNDHIFAFSISFKSSHTAHHEDVGNGIQNDKDGFRVLRSEKIQKWFQYIGLNKVNHLLNCASTGEICNGPNSLFLGFVVTLSRR